MGEMMKAPEMLAQSLGLEVDQTKMFDLISATCFPGVNPSLVSDEHLVMYINIAWSLREQCPTFNPLLPSMLYGFLGKNNSVQIIIGPNAVFAMLSSRQEVTGWDTELEYDEKKKLVACVATIKRRDGLLPIQKRVFLEEWIVPSNPNWQTRPRHMLEIRAIKQCARMIIHGMPFDREEAELVQAGYAEVEPEGKVFTTKTQRLAKKLGMDDAQPETQTIDQQENEEWKTESTSSEPTM